MNNTDPQAFYTNQPGPHPQVSYYNIQNSGIEAGGYPPQMRGTIPYQSQRLPQQYINPPMAAGFTQPFYYQYPQHQYMPSNSARSVNPQSISIVRPPTEIPYTIVQQNGFNPQYATGNNIASATPVYQQQFYTGVPYPMSGAYSSQPGSSQMTNPPPIPPQSQYSLTSMPQPPTSVHPTSNVQHLDQPVVGQSISGMQATVPQNNVYTPSAQPTGPVEKRKRTPLTIRDPASLELVQVAPTAASSTATTTEPRVTESSTKDSTTSNTKPTTDTNNTKSDFQRQVAERAAGTSSSKSEKNAHQQSVSNDKSSSNVSTKATDTVTQPTAAAPQPSSSESSSRSGSMSRPKSPTPVSISDLSATPSKESTSSKSSEQPQPAHPGILRRPTIDENSQTTPSQDDTQDKADETDSLKHQDSDVVESTENNSIEPLKQTYDEPRNSTNDDPISSPPDVETPPPASATSSLDTFTPPQTPSAFIQNEKSQELPNQRLRYDRQELLRIRDSSAPFPIPQNLPDLDIVVNRRDNNRFPYTGTISQGRINPSFHRQSSGSNHPSLTRYQNPSNSGTDSRRKPVIYLQTEPELCNRVENPYKPVDQAQLDANSKILRDVKSILNKVTPQTFEKLQKKLETLEIDRYERLEGMITIFFSKAVDEPAFSFLYAKLCKQFQKKQVTVPGEDGKTVTHYFRQILLTRCQKEFENDYRQEIEYERRKNEVESITDENKRKEDAEKLEEDLVKAKRRKLGNIFFIGELFKLQMLTDTIMYDCIDYLLRDKTDEEALECLCKLLRTIGKELDGKAMEKPQNKSNLEKHYRELDTIVKEQKTSARIRFMIQDLIELRQASWVARRAEAKPMTIDEIHEQERLKREQQEREQERERQQRRDQNRPVVIGTAYSGGGQQAYNDSRGSRGSGMKQQAARNDDDRTENRFNVNTLRQLQSNDKRNQGPFAMNLAPQRTWSKGSGIDKKPEEDRSATGRTGKPPAGPVQQLKGKIGPSQGGSSYPIQRQSSRELARESSHRDRENALLSLRKTTTGSGVNSPINAAGTSSMTNSREGSRNVSREQSRNASRESSVSERMSSTGLSSQISKSSANESPTIINPDPSNVSFDEEKIQARVHSLIEEYTGNYSESNDRPVKEGLEDLGAFSTTSIDQQSIIVRELFTNVLEAKPRGRKAVGHLLNAALNAEILSTSAFLSGFKMIVEAAPDYAVDIPLIWQYIGEILGAFIGAPTSYMVLLKPMLECVPDDKSKQLFQYIIRYATEFSSRSRIQNFWQSSEIDLRDLMKPELIDSSFSNDYEWLSEAAAVEPSSPSTTREAHVPRADPQLVRLFKSVNEQNSTVGDAEIIKYIREHMDPKEKFYIRNIVLSYLEACLINREPQKKIQEDIAKKRMNVLNTIIEHKPEAEIQAVYAIQNFVNKLEHPPKMARLLFDIFYDEECVSEDAFFEWLKHPDQSETEGHAVVEMSTKDFFTWLQQAETEVEEGEEEEGN